MLCIDEAVMHSRYDSSVDKGFVSNGCLVSADRQDQT
jgi:hypothetical protein